MATMFILLNKSLKMLSIKSVKLDLSCKSAWFKVYKFQLKNKDIYLFTISMGSKCSNSIDWMKGFDISIKKGLMS